jgi:hypothetical protein
MAITQHNEDREESRRWERLNKEEVEERQKAEDKRDTATWENKKDKNGS